MILLRLTDMAELSPAALGTEFEEPPLAHGEFLHVLKHDDLFAVFDARGDIFGQMHPVGPSTGADGLFQDDTRVLSGFWLRIAGQTPLLLSAGTGADNVIFSANLTNPRFTDDAGVDIHASEIHINRRRLLWNKKLHEALLLQNYGAIPVAFELSFIFDADFRDVFEIRGATRNKRGNLIAPEISDSAVRLGYRGLDGRLRRTGISFSRPIRVRGQHVSLPICLPPGGSAHLQLAISSDGSTDRPDRTQFFGALKRRKREARSQIRRLDRIASDNPKFDHWLGRAASDLALLTTQLESGPYPYAGIPWFSVPFGRDAIITALQTLWIEPSIAQGVLSFLSGSQAVEQSSFRDSAPGKIMHETRRGEMAALSEVPFAAYYGGVDTTPLFVMLAGAYFQRTADLEFAQTIWPSVSLALAWIDRFGDVDGDGLTEYLRGEATGLQNQGWKDSADSVFHADGELATGAIALVEVQAYVAAAKHAASILGAALGRAEDATRLKHESGALCESIDRMFWRESLGTFAIALDGEKRACDIRASNAGHVLFAGAARADRAASVGEQLMSRDSFSGWGVRTVAEGQARYNPMSYHNGTIWPHDSAIVAAGLARYGMTEKAARIFTGLFDAASNMAHWRLPELFCGFHRRAGEDPVAYPSACTPQAWASGAPFLLLQSCLGVSLDAASATIKVTRPYLPPWISDVRIGGLALGDGRCSLRFRGRGDNVGVRLDDVSGDVKLLVGDEITMTSD